MDYALRQLNHPGLHIVAYDNDTVEEHNVGRQNFSPFDIGQNKALCLIEKINNAYGLQWEAMPKKVTKFLPKTNITISAVDHAQFRMQLQSLIANFNEFTSNQYNNPYYWLDLGNGKDFGQAILGTIQPINQPKSEKFTTSQQLQNVVDVYGELTNYDTQEKQGITSCSFLDSISKQDLFINDAVAIAGCTMLWKLFKDFYVKENSVFLNQETFNSKSSLLIK
jgi:PRTRC genetic system ThiF family protein